MEWKIITGQLCLTAIAITCLVQKINHGLLYATIGALATSIGIPFIIESQKTK